MVRRALRLLTALALAISLCGLATSQPARATDPMPHAAGSDHCPDHAAKHPGLAPACCIACTLVATLPVPQTIMRSDVAYAVAFVVPAAEPGRGIMHRPDPFPPKTRPLG